MGDFQCIWYVRVEAKNSKYAGDKQKKARKKAEQVTGVFVEEMQLQKAKKEKGKRKSIEEEEDEDNEEEIDEE